MSSFPLDAVASCRDVVDFHSFSSSHVSSTLAVLRNFCMYREFPGRKLEGDVERSYVDVFMCSLFQKPGTFVVTK